MWLVRLAAKFHLPMGLSRFAARFSPRKSATEPPARSQQTFATQQNHAAEHQNSDKGKQLPPIDAEQAPVIQKVYGAVTNTGKREQPSPTRPGRSMSPSEILMLPNVDKGKPSSSTNPGQARILQSSPNTVEDVDKGKEPSLIDHQPNARAAETMNKGKQPSPVDLEKAFPAQQSSTAAEAMDTQTTEVMKPQIPKPIDKGKQRMSGSLYSPLSKNPHEIRVLEIIDTTGEKLECQMHTVVLGANLKFSALSYVWGDRNDPHNQVVIIVNGRDKVVTRSLESALRHAGNAWKREFPRRPLSSFRLWADALCINQDDIPERNHQVGLMASIYSQADMVLAWLGLDPNGVIHLAFESLRKVWNAVHGRELPGTTEEAFNLLRDRNAVRGRGLPGTTEEAFNLLRDQTALYGNPGPGDERDPIATARWEAVSHFHDLPNWKRVWICQEFVLARRLVMYTPSVSGDIEAIGYADGVLLFAFSHFLWGTIMDTDIPIIVRALPPSFSRSADFLDLFMTRQLHKLRSYTEVLSKIGFELDATDRHDHVFGMLSLSNLDMQHDISEGMYAIIAIDVLIMVVGYDDDDTIHLDALNLRGRLASLGLDLGPESFMESFCKMFGVSISDPRSSLARRYVNNCWGDGKATWNSINGHDSKAVSPSLQNWEFYKPAEMEGAICFTEALSGGVAAGWAMRNCRDSGRNICGRNGTSSGDQD
ncbi:hypothetical protein GGTG_13443 [Gaeumannomyces tritici R3-111a-1]|uniref:Heterokaryon incompatibility domain-containing protein n=1 Tax=Gaeumannomyces tritici (strain R3-111a-1) TaxID=644352 RepID=J3PIW3_GAET3|nr:hypothetical protein GGTG_13443 [Gaeumannomyces tritici R3-111a-1]EJT69046.1 hypothetical protein GGTG_13443 [Gaeumannomyces tritici R3-111a-1]